MKKIFIIIALAFVLITCETESMDEVNPFVGTWEAASGYHTVFSKTVVTNYDNNGDLHWKGPYTYDDTHITVNFDYAVQIVSDAFGDIWVSPYFFQDDDLFLNNVRLTKIKD